jgi:hypothetical protein
MPHPPLSIPQPQTITATLRTALEVLTQHPRLPVSQELALHMGLALIEAACLGTSGDEQRRASP